MMSKAVGLMCFFFMQVSGRRIARCEVLQMVMAMQWHAVPEAS